MCGLTFVIHRDSSAYKLDDFFGEAMIANQVRGVDASGLFQIDKQGALFTKKQAVCASSFLQDTQVQRIVRDVNKCPLTVGHVRHATVGDKDNDANAHPFVFEREDRSRVVGVHNGTLRGWKDKKGSEEQDVDSSWAIQMIAEEGLDAFTHFDGPFAFIWWDSREPDSVWIARNSERTLYYYQSEDGKSMFGCSELGMLGWLAAKNGFGKHRNGDSGLHYFETGHAYKISITNIGRMKKFELPKYDPKTTVKREAANEVPAGYFPQRNEEGGSNNSCPVPFVMGPTGVIQSRINGTGSTTTRGNTRTASTRDLYGPIVRSKLALRRARDRRLGRSGYIKEENPDIITTECLDERMESGIQRALNDAAKKKPLDPWKFVDVDRRVQKPNDRTATSVEITNAVWNKVYGRVVALMGVDYDEETSELLGEAYIVDESGKQTTIDCCLRNIPQKVARDVYINGPDPVLVAIIGEISPKGLEPPMYVVATLDLKNRIELCRQNMRKEVDSVLPETDEIPF